MYRISNLIEDAFRKNLRLAEQRRVAFDFDFPDPTLRIEHPSLLKEPLSTQLPLAVERAKSRVSFKVTRDGILIRDDGIPLTPNQVKDLSTDDAVTVKSRVGFGTEVRIKYL